jgi:hypothetical protein
MNCLIMRRNLEGHMAKASKKAVKKAAKPVKKPSKKKAA